MLGHHVEVLDDDLAVTRARVEDPAFSPADRIGALEMQNLSITDNRNFLMHHLDSVARLGQSTSPLPELLGKTEK